MTIKPLTIIINHKNRKTGAIGTFGFGTIKSIAMKMLFKRSPGNKTPLLPVHSEGNRVVYIIKKTFRRKIIKALVAGFVLLYSQPIAGQNNLALTGVASSSAEQDKDMAGLAIDGNRETAWQSENTPGLKWLAIVLPGAIEIKEVRIYLEKDNNEPVRGYALQTFLNGFWRDQVKQVDNQQKQVTITLDKVILTDRFRLAFENQGTVLIKEFEVYGEQYVDTTAAPVKKILVNQSGYNLNKPKRFTAPGFPDNTSFTVKNLATQKTVFRGSLQNEIGDFSGFNPLSGDTYVVAIDTSLSYPFNIGPFWLERVTYRNMVDFMVGARHYTGTTDRIRRLSWAWRDGDFFNWAMQSLIAQFLSNPAAYERMDKKIVYQSNDAFSAPYQGKWGKLEPYDESAPDIVKLIHWDADVKISQQLEHEHQKAELAHFLYAFPYLRQWLPQQNFDVVYDYLKEKWTKPDVAERSSSQYDKSPEHNLLALKTRMGTTKGELPPGHSVIPNLMMYEVTKQRGEPDAGKYFDAAYRQMQWMIANLDWKDPITTKGQRTSEHITMRAFAYFYQQYPHRAPEGLYEKVKDWAEVAIARADNLWDFRKYTDDGDWVPAGWNEPGNILGFPACALAAMSVLRDTTLDNGLQRLVWSHFDNAFGRNPTGRHFSYDGPAEIEGVDLGWYAYHHEGIGLLAPVRFVFDGAPKTNHYPNNPKIGNLGWTEGWVQFNTAFNTSMAYLAYHENELTLTRTNQKTIKVRLKAPLNFDDKKIDQVAVEVVAASGDTLLATLTEEGPYSHFLVGNIQVKKGKADPGDKILQIRKSDTIKVSYGLGYFKKEASMRFGKKSR